MKCSKLFTYIPAILLGVCITPAFAVDGVYDKANLPDLFELDGDPYQDTGAPWEEDWYTPHDWDILDQECDSVTGVCPEIGGQSVPYEFTTILSDPAPVTIFTQGGSKDTHDIIDHPGWNGWAYKDGSVPDKDDIVNAFAAAYVNPANICYDQDGETACLPSDTPLHYAGDLIIYFGLDRFDNSGDAFAGFWFLQNDVELLDGKFTAGHVAKRSEWDDDLQEFVILPGDLLVLVEYPQGFGAIPVIKAYMWDPDLLPPENLDENFKSIGPLEMIYSSANGLATAQCDGKGGKLACAITNHEDLDDAPPNWTYLSKDGTDWFPFETFYEGGINLTQLLGGQNICVHTFLAETRSSRSETAQLKDFVRGRFDLCGSEIITVIYDGDDNPVGFPASDTPAAVMAGTQIYDEATVTFTGPGIKMDPEGYVDFYLYNSPTSELPACSGDPIEGTPVRVTLDPGTTGDNIATAKTGLFTSLDAAQCYSFHAEFTSTNTKFPGAMLEDAACEWVCIDKYPSLITTEIHKDGGHANITFGREPVQTKLHDHAYVKVDGTFPGAPTPTGTVTFKLWKNQVCQPVDVPFSGTFGGVVWPQIVTPLTGGEAWTATFEPSFGFFGILAEYSGDANYDPSVLAVTNCEFLEIYKVDPSILTKVIVRDRAVVTGGLADVPTGNVTINTYRSSDCSGPVENTVILPLPETGPDVGVVTQSTELEQILEVGNNVASYLATYEGDDNYLPRDHGCEVVQFSVQ